VPILTVECPALSVIVIFRSPGNSGQDASFRPPHGRGIQAIPDDTPLACWLPVKTGLTPHGLRHSHKTWMAEDAIPEILAEQRLGHQVPGMRGLYAHASERMRDELKAALQARWEESLAARAAIHPYSPVPIFDELLAPHREATQQPPAPVDREKMISQIPPKRPEAVTTATRLEPVLRASDLARYQNRSSGASETRTRDPLLAKSVPSVQHRLWPGKQHSDRPPEAADIRPRWCQRWVSTGLFVPKPSS
jgi:hypothetical protein